MRTEEKYGYSDYHSEVYFKRDAETHTDIYIKIEEGDARKMGYTDEDCVESITEEVITGVTGSEYLITEPREHWYICVTTDDRWYVSINKVGNEEDGYNYEEVHIPASQVDMTTF